MDLKDTTLTPPGVTDLYPEWHKNPPQFRGEEQLFLEDITSDLTLPEAPAPKPAPQTGTNDWYTTGPELQRDAKQREDELRRYVIKNYDDPEEMFARMRASRQLADQSGMDPNLVFENFDSITQELYGRPMTGVSTMQAIGDAWKIGQISDDLNGLYWMQLMNIGDQEAVQAEIDRLNAEMPAYDEVKRSWFTKVTKDAAMVVPGMLDTMKEGAKKGLIVAMGTGTMTALAGQLGPQVALGEEVLTVPAATGAGFAIGHSYGSTLTSMQKEAGSCYQNLVVNEGFDPEFARGVSIAVGVASGLVETVQISSIPGFKDVFTAGMQRAVKEFTYDTAAKKFAKGTVKYLGNAASNAGEEVIQEIIHGVGQDIAANHEGLANDPRVWEELDMLAETGVQSFQTFLLIGAPGATVKPAASALVKRLQQTPENAPARSEQGEVAPAAVPDRQVFRDTPGSVTMNISDIEQGVFFERGNSEYDLAREVYNQAKEGGTPLPPIRVMVDQDGTYQAVDNANLQIALEAGDNAVEVEIVEGPIAPRTDASIAADPAWSKTAAEYRGSADIIASAQEAKILEFTAQNDINAFTDNMRKAFPQADQREINASIGLMEAVAAAEGKSSASYIQEVFAPGVFTRDGIKAPIGLTDDGWSRVANIVDFDNDALRSSFLKTVNFQEVPFEEGTYGRNNSRKISEVFWQNFLENNDVQMEGWRTKEDLFNRLKNAKIPDSEIKYEDITGYKAAAEFLDDGKALIHLTEQSDFSSWVHEFGHIIRRRLPQADQETLLDYYKSKEWTVDAEEQFVRDFENYLLKGQAPTSKLRELFNRIAEGLRKIYEKLNQISDREEEVEIPAEVKAVFDSIFTERDKREVGYDGQYEIDSSMPIFQVEAYHGSAHNFDQFSLEYMGAGEGNQAFGWGLYFTSKEEIAKFYANALTEVRVDGKLIKDLDDTGFAAMMEYKRRGGLEPAVKFLTEFKELQDELIQEHTQKKIDWLQENKDKITHEKRNLYSVTLNQGQEDVWLDWSEPFPFELRVAVMEELEKSGLPVDLHGVWDSKYNSTGRGIYRKITGLFMNEETPEGLAQKYASQLLNRAGFDGVKYPADSLTGKRAQDWAAGWNYVVFNDQKVQVKNHVLFQPGDKDTLFQDDEHEQIIRTAVEEHKPVPMRVLEEYQDRDWAQAEIQRREVWKKYEWLESLARGFDSWEELKAWFDAKAQVDDGEIKRLGDDEDTRFYQELWMRASFKPREEANQLFLDVFANREGVTRMAADIASDQKQYRGMGIPGPIFTIKSLLKAGKVPTDKQYAAAIKSLKNNPVQVRRALAAIDNDDIAMMALDYEDQIEEATPYSVKVEDLTPQERIRQAFKVEDPELKQVLLSGVGSDSQSLLEMERICNREIATLKAKQTKAMKELEEKLGWEKSRVLSLKESLDKKIKEARDLKKMTELDTLEAIRDTKKDIYKKQAKQREILKTKDKMRALGASIERKPSSLTCHIDYQKEIKALQSLIDGRFRRKGNAEEWFRRNKFYEENPGALEVLKPEDIDKISKKPLNYWSLDELEDLNEKINQLREQGRVKLEMKEIKKKMETDKLVRAMAMEIGGAKLSQTPDVPFTDHNPEYKKWLKTYAMDHAKIQTWRPSRYLRDLGGEGSTVEKYFWRRLNHHLDAELQMKNKRIDAGKAKLKELGMTMKDLQETVNGPSGPLPLNDVIHFYIVRNNEDNLKALVSGTNIGDIEGRVDYRMSEEERIALYREQLQPYMDQLTVRDIALADFIAKDFDDNYDRYAKAFENDKNEEMGKVQGGYFPMRRVKMVDTERNDEIASMMTSRAGLTDGYAKHHGTHSRIEIKDEHQNPIKLGAFDNWMQEVEEQEHYIHSVGYIKQMHRVLNDPVFQTAMVNEHGKAALDWMEKYVNEFANPTLYKFYDSTAKWSQMLRSNLAVAYLSFNMMTVAKQAPSLALFMGRVGPLRLMASAGKFMTSWNECLDFVNERDPQMKERSMDRIMEELKLQRENKLAKFTKKFGEIGLALITKVDKMATTIGWMAVYDANVKQVGEAEAIRLAQEAVLETQPAARAKDLAQVYRSAEGLNWFLMFSNQLNQTFNMVTADLPSAVKKTFDKELPKEVRKAQAERAIGMVAGMMVSFAGIAVLNGWKPWEEEEPEEIAKSWGEMAAKALFNTVPIVGGNIVSGIDGWMGKGVDPLPAASELGRLLGTIADQDSDAYLKRIGKLAETTAVIGGIPVMPVKRLTRAGKALMEEEPGDALLETLGYRTDGDY